MTCSNSLTAARVARQKIEQAVMDPGEAQSCELLVGFVGHRAKTEMHRFQCEVQFLFAFAHDDYLCQ
jgi:hypothetical protein